MKKLIFSWLLSVLFLSAANAQYGTERTGYEGDYFSLEGAIELFKQSNSINDFERKINREDTWVNNLDLNYDGRIDYIRVEHRRQGNFHAIVLQVPISRYDVQDVAVIEIEKTGRREAILQIVGDEYLYGEQVIVEPYEIEGYSNSRVGYNPDYEYRNDYVNVYYWPAVQRIFQPHYQVYISPYRWQYYPVWWSPWHQCAWHVYHPRIVVYHRHYHVVHVHRVIRVHNFYSPHRTYSHSVAQRTDEVRIKHGKQPIHRPAAQQAETRSDYRKESKRVEQSPGNTVQSPRTAPQVNKKERSTPYQSPRPSVDNNKRTTPKANKQERSTPYQSPRPSVDNNKRTTPKANKQQRSTPYQSPRPSVDNNKRTTPKVNKQQRSTPKQSPRPSVNSKKTTPSSSNKATKNTAPQKSSSKSQRRN